MQYHQFSTAVRPSDKSLLAAHFQLREELFGGWSAPNHCAGLEADVFDTPLFDPIWSVVVDDGECPMAVGRMVPADAGGTMIEHVWPEAIGKRLPPKDMCFEVHRIGVSQSLPIPEQMASALSLRIGLEQHALDTGRPWLTLMTAEKIWQATLQHMAPIGPVIDVDGVPSIALMVEIDQAEIDLKRGQLALIERKIGVGRKVA